MTRQGPYGDPMMALSERAAARRLTRRQRRQDPTVVVGEIVKHPSPVGLCAREMAPDMEREDRNYEIRLAAFKRKQIDRQQVTLSLLRPARPTSR